MSCPRCQHQNPAGQKFCGECGAPLAATCAACGAPNPPGQKFCGECGAPLTPVGVAEKFAAPHSYTPRHLAEKILTSRSALEGERKQVTVLFCDIVDSSRLAEQLDPEGMHEVMDRALRLMAEAVHRYEGTVNQFLGDGLMALFGAPLALEDHALRGVQAALAIRETLSGYSEQLKRERAVEMRLRLGLNTGLVVVGRIGDDLRMDYTAVGDTTHLAARMQTLAEPGTILVTEATHRLVEGHVRSEALGPVQVKGRSEPVSVHKVTGRRRARTRLDVSAERGLTPLVGRERELGLLQDCFARVKAGRGQVVGIVGEAGVGKSRVLYEFKRLLEGERVTWLEGHCVSYGQATPYLPVLEILRTNFHVEEEDNPLQIGEKLRQGFRVLDPNLEGILPFLGELFGLPLDDEVLKKLDPKTKRQKTFEAIRALTMAGSQRRPHVVIVEDLHWIDKTSEDYLAFLIDSLAGMPLLLLTTQRPGYSVRWADKTYYTQIALDLLTDVDTEVMLAQLLGARELPADLTRLVREKAEGNPLFVEEITRSLLERGVLVRSNGQVRWSQEARVEFPPTAQDIIRARVDHLEEPVKRALQTAAVIGRDFGPSLLARVSEAHAELDRHLQALKRLELIHEIRFFPEPEYSFKHAVIRDVAYESLLVHQRKGIHRLIGEAIEELYPDRLAEQYEILARHFSAADEREKALEYFEKAGDKAARAVALGEALALYEGALALVDPDNPMKKADLLVKLANVSTFVTSDAEADRVLAHAESALPFFERLGDKRSLLNTHLNVAALYIGGYWDATREDKALEHLEAAAALAEGDPDSVEKGLTYQRTAHLYLHRGQPATAIPWAQRAADLFARLRVPIGTALGTALTYTGQIDEGIAYNEKNWEPVLKVGNPLVIAILGHELSLTLALARDVPRAREWGERALSELLKTQSIVFHGLLRRPLALIYTLSGDVSRAEEHYQAARAIQAKTKVGCYWEDAAAMGFYPFRRGEWDTAEEYLERMVPMYQEMNQLAAVAAYSFTLGSLNLGRGNHSRAEELFLRSLKICRDGGNVLFELWVLPVLVELYLKIGQMAKAAENVARGFELLKPGQNWYGLAGPVYLAKGMFGSASRNWEEATSAFEKAVAINRQYQLPWDEAEALYEWGLMHLARGEAGDREAAREKLNRSLEIFQHVGAKKDVEKVLAAMERL
ncbi:MAG: AAA family ATPase [Candidatus Rokubacteria bacterium]|nr:AAA family ATPase [Candidatus Rokubacteria bacterium]